MSLLSEGSWPRCPKHFTWMQPTLKPRQWRCNLPVYGGPDFDGRGSTCPESERYRWWRSLDRTVFSLLEWNVTRAYYCPVCESFFGAAGGERGFSPPYFRLCETCLRMGTEHYLRYQSCGQCGGEIEFFGDEQTLFRVDQPGVYCRKCRKFLCSHECVAQHLCMMEKPRHEN